MPDVKALSAGLTLTTIAGGVTSPTAQLADKKALTLDAARKISAAAEAEAKKTNRRMVIAVVSPADTESARPVPAPVIAEASAPSATIETAVLAGGCSWGVQGVFQHVHGVTSGVSGYAGGNADTATYAAVGSDSTGHAESARIVFAPRRSSTGHAQFNSCSRRGCRT